MFGRIAHRYDLLNRLLSVGQDVRWRRLIRERIDELRPKRVLDVCTGTGDLALSFPSSTAVFGSDFCLPMLALAAHKGRRLAFGGSWFAADALQLPVADDSVDAVTVAFGIRNFEDLGAGLRELARVIRPRGRLLVLEFSQPRGTLSPLLTWWVRRVPPMVGRIVSGDPEAYGYLTASVASFPDGDALCGIMRSAGVAPVDVRPLTGGVATLYDGAVR
jgi:demethylmenaquinone methyltransferase/2-methoxy-6-polyprenyl-1,4-benzoquinol methylase